MGTEAGLAAAELAHLARFNALPAEDARRDLLACCASAAWAGRLAAGRPYPSLAAATAQSDAAVAAMTTADLAEALAGHPRIGEPPASGQGSGCPAGGHDGRAADWSRQEQSGMRGADSETGRALADGNAAYERRFGHIYLVCASGRSAGELLDLLSARLGNDDETEWLVVRRELQNINNLRLRKLLAGPA